MRVKDFILYPIHFKDLVHLKLKGIQEIIDECEQEVVKEGNSDLLLFYLEKLNLCTNELKKINTQRRPEEERPEETGKQISIP